MPTGFGLVNNYAKNLGEIDNSLKEILSKKFNSGAKVIKNDKRSPVLNELSTSKKEVIDFFFKHKFNAGKKVYDINVPDIVKTNINHDNVYSFISGLMDSDGHISKRDGDLEYTTVSSGLADDLLEIFSKAGILLSSSLKISKKGNEENTFRLRVPAYQITAIKDKLQININLLNIKQNLSNRKKRRFPVVRVKTASKTNVEDVQFYDLTTKKNHNYLAGKKCLVFVHNTVFHVFLGEKLPSKESTRNLVKKIASNYRMPYFSLTPSFSICPVHGYLNGEHEFCPVCEHE